MLRRRKNGTPVIFICLKEMIETYHDTFVKVVQVPLFDCFLS